MSPRYGLKPCRDVSMLHKVGYLIRWMYERVETRYRVLDCEHRVSISNSFEVPCKWVEKYIIGLCHRYQEYHNDFQIGDYNGNHDASTISRMNDYCVYDIPLQGNYIVDTSNHKCSYHIPHWKKVPCLHVIAMLCFRNEFSRV